MKREMHTRARALNAVFVAIILAASLMSCTGAPAPETVTTDDFAARVDAVVQSELVIEGLRVPLAALSKSAANLALPDERGRDVMEATIMIVDLAPAPTKGREPLLDLGFERGHWPASGTSETVEKEKLSLWREFLTLVDFFHLFNFYNIRGEMTNEESYRTDAGFKGLAQLRSGAIMAVEGKLGLEWKGRVERVGDVRRWCGESPASRPDHSTSRRDLSRCSPTSVTLPSRTTPGAARSPRRVTRSSRTSSSTFATVNWRWRSIWQT